MEDKKYIDKILNYFVRGTRIESYNYENGGGIIYLPFEPFWRILSSFIPPSSFPSLSPFFSKHCKDTFGLTDEEINYVWKEYITIIKNKIDNGE